jgi:hypothetical protein
VTAGNDFSIGPVLSADSAFVAFTTVASDLVPGGTDTNGWTDVVLFERATGVVRLVSRTNGNAVRGVSDAAGGTPDWPAVTVLAASNPLLAQGRYVVVGSGDGKLYQLDIAGGGPPVVKSIVLGDGLSVIGAPTLDVFYNLVYVGSDSGVIYAVQLPLP